MISKLSDEYIAAYIDADGSIGIQVRFPKVGRFSINPRISIGQKLTPETLQLLTDIQEYLDAGKIYYSNKNDPEIAKIVWQTTNY